MLKQRDGSKMEVRRVFVASSIVTFAKERKRLGAFFTALNNQLINKKIFFDVKFCEELDNAVPEVRKQNEYNEYIENSDFVIFLLGQECGSYTFEEFEIALNSGNDSTIMIFYENFHVNTILMSDTVKWIKQQADTNERVNFIEYSQYSEIEEKIYEHIKQDSKTFNSYEVCNVSKKIRFFLGTSNWEYEEEHNEILRFILNLNEKLLKKGVYAEIEPCNYDNFPIDFITQNQLHEQYIEDSDAAFFVFFLEADDSTRRELDYSLSQFRKCGRPKIYTYFFEHTGTEDASISNLKDMIATKINHYYSVFTNVDSIKLSILIQISDILKDSFVISIENKCIVTQDNVVLEMNNIPIISQNRALIDLNRRLSEVEKEYEEVAGQFSRDIKRRDLLDNLSQLDDAKMELKEKIEKEEKEILVMLYEMNRTIAKGKIDDLLRKAYTCLEKGDVENAAKILSKTKVDSLFKDDLHAKMDSFQEDAKTAIQMYGQTIKIQKLLVETTETIQTILDCYEEIFGYVTAVNFLDCYVILEYAMYLDLQNLPKAEQIFKQAEYLFTNPERNMNKESFADLYSSMGNYFLKQYDVDLAESYLKKYYDIAKELYCENSEVYSNKFAEACLSYAKLNPKSKLKILEEGLQVLLQFTAASGVQESVLDIVTYYYERGSLYGNINKLDKEMESYKKGIELLEKNHINNEILADLYNNLAEVLRNSNGQEKSGKSPQYYYEKAITILEGLYDSNSSKYAEALGDVYNNMCICYLNYNNGYYQGLQYLKKCEKVYSTLYYQNPRRGGQGLAECYIQMSNVYDSLGNKKRAVESAEKGVAIFEYLFSINRNRFAIKLSWAYSETGLLYALSGDLESCANNLEKSLDILECTENEYIKSKQTSIIVKIISALTFFSTQVQKKDEVEEVFFSLAHRAFKFGYEYMKDDLMEEYPEFIALLYKIGQGLMYYFEKKDLAFAKEYYYPAILELGKSRIKNNNLTPEDRMEITFTLSAITGLLGDTETGANYLIESVESFLMTDDFKRKYSKMNINKKKKKKKRK